MLEWLGIIALFSMAACLSPGPNNIMLVLSAINFGLKPTLPHYFGVCFGYPVKIVLISLGITELAAHFSMISFFVRLGGSLFLLLYALNLLVSVPTSTNKQQRPLTYREASLFQWLNVKGWVIAFSAGSLLPDYSTESFFASLVVGVCFLVVSLPCYSVFVLFGAKFRHTKVGLRYSQYVSQFGAVLLGASALISLYLPLNV